MTASTTIHLLVKFEKKFTVQNKSTRSDKNTLRIVKTKQAE